MRIQWEGSSTPDWASLLRAGWEAERRSILRRRCACWWRSSRLTGVRALIPWHGYARKSSLKILFPAAFLFLEVAVEHRFVCSPMTARDTTLRRSVSPKDGSRGGRNRPLQPSSWRHTKPNCGWWAALCREFVRRRCGAESPSTALGLRPCESVPSPCPVLALLFWRKGGRAQISKNKFMRSRR